MLGPGFGGVGDGDVKVALRVADARLRRGRERRPEVGECAVGIANCVEDAERPVGGLDGAEQAALGGELREL